MEIEYLKSVGFKLTERSDSHKYESLHSDTYISNDGKLIITHYINTNIFRTNRYNIAVTFEDLVSMGYDKVRFSMEGYEKFKKLSNRSETIKKLLSE